MHLLLYQSYVCVMSINGRDQFSNMTTRLFAKVKAIKYAQLRVGSALCLTDVDLRLERVQGRVEATSAHGRKADLV